MWWNKLDRFNLIVQSYLIIVVVAECGSRKRWAWNRWTRRGWVSEVRHCLIKLVANPFSCRFLPSLLCCCVSLSVTNNNDKVTTSPTNRRMFIFYYLELLMMMMMWTLVGLLLCYVFLGIVLLGIKANLSLLLVVG